MPFTTETAKIAGKKSRRGKAKISITMREFVFAVLKENRQKFRYMLSELSPRQFVDIYLRLIPYIISMRHLQNFNVDDLTKESTKELIKDIIEKDS
tara:strand:- start:782 stop:1069 length:288 start_codon:yes stop_codon:yes gene_type:complete